MLGQTAKLSDINCITVAETAITQQYKKDMQAKDGECIEGLHKI